MSVILLLFATLIKFNWAPSPGPAPVASYKLCIGLTPGACTTTASVAAPATEKVVDLDVSKVWYATVRAVNPFGESDPSGQVIVGKPLPPAALNGSLSVG